MRRFTAPTPDRHLVPEFGSVPLGQLAPHHFRDLKETKLLAEGKLSPAAINRILGTAPVIFNYAVSMEEMEFSPVSSAKESKRDAAGTRHSHP